MDEKKYYYSEIFHSIQGEGHYTGVPTAWIRFFLCNLQCNGFGQIDPSDPSTYELPFESYDVSQVKRVEDLPVWDKGCDSSYTWAKKYKHLMGQETPTVLANKIVDILKTDSNPDGLFLHPVTNQRQHLCITGGEPLMITGQAASMGIYKELQKQARASLSKGTVTITHLITQIIRLHQVSCGFVGLDGGGVDELPSHRLTELMEILEETDGKVIIWANYRHDIQKIQD